MFSAFPSLGEAKSQSPRIWLLENSALVARPVHPALTDGEQTALAEGDLPLGTTVLVDLTPEGKKAYGHGP